MQQIDYNSQFLSALELLEKGEKPLFITGKAGTGKSTLLSLFLGQTKKNVVVLAPTGVAALNVKGSTIHSFFEFNPGITVEKAKEKGRRVKETALIHSIEMIIIDEISMVRADLLDCIDVFLKAALKVNEPFGGIRVVFIGDLYQLPPVLRSDEKTYFEQIYNTPYFFSSKVMEEASFDLIELEKIYRQNDVAFIEVLNAIRKNCATDEQLAYINQRVVPFEGEGIYLTSTNKAAAEINEAKLQQLKTELHTFAASTEGEFEQSHAPADFDLRIKVDSQVMILNNHPEGLWVNGTVGKVVEIKEKGILVKKEEGGKVLVEPYKWTVYKYRLEETTGKLAQEEVGSFKQYPLCLAWGITIHKSQGKTFERAIIDLSRSFAAGQAYVALSRCRTFEGLHLKVPVRKDQIRIEPSVVKFLTTWQYELAKKKCSLEERIRLIEKAISEKKMVSLVYLKSNDEKSTRNVQPLSVGPLIYQNRKYIGMQAYCMKRGETRLFNVDRILEIEAI
jgi:ATP-dependent DNA helicase PIF1